MHPSIPSPLWLLAFRLHHIQHRLDYLIPPPRAAQQHYFSIASQVQTIERRRRASALLPESINVLGDHSNCAPSSSSAVFPYTQTQSANEPGGPNALGRNSECDANVTCDRSQSNTHEGRGRRDALTDIGKGASERIRKCNSRRFCI